MKEVTYASDYLAVHLLAMAQKTECLFAERLMACPKTEDNLIKVDDPEDFTALLEQRLAELTLSMAALEVYLGYYAGQTAMAIEWDKPGISLADYLADLDMLEIFKEQPTRVRRRHENLMEEYGAKPVRKFLAMGRLFLDEKILYYPLLRTRRLISYKDGYVKKIVRLINLKEELAIPPLPMTHDMSGISSAEELAGAFLHHPLPEGLTPGKSCSDMIVTEAYDQEHFIWELLHCYPARSVQEFIQYIHRLDQSDQHFISIMKAAALVDDSGKPLTREVPRFAIEVPVGG